MKKRGARRRKLKRARASRQTPIRHVRKKTVKKHARLKARRSQQNLMPPRQAVVRAQELAFQLLIAIDRGALVHRFLRWYANECDRPGRISNPGRYRELVETIRREAFLALALQVEEESAQRLVGRSGAAANPAQAGLIKLFHDEFYIALGRSLDFSGEEFREFCRDIEVYRSLQGSRRVQPRRASSAPTGPFVDRCGFLLDSPLLSQGRQAAAKLESDLRATASGVIRKVFSRRSFL